MKRLDISGRRFGAITALWPIEHRPGGYAWMCRCDCGQERESIVGNLTSGKIQSCGCKKAASISRSLIVHGHARKGARTALHRAWSMMLDRCKNPRNIGFKNYGGRGIAVCERWHKFENFLADMGDRPEGMSIDRINNDGNYEPRNCRWATRSQQQRNKRKQ